MATHHIFVDIGLQRQLVEQHQQVIKEDWALLFYPKGFVSEHEIDSVEQFQLTAEKLKKLGLTTTKLRNEIKYRALEMINNIPEAQVKELDEICKLRIRKRIEDCDSKLAAQRSKLMKTHQEPTSTWKRKKGLQRRLKMDDKVEALYMVFIDKENQATVARHFRVTAPAISRLVVMALKNPRLLSEMMSKRAELQQQKAAIRTWIEEMLQHNVFLDSVASVTKTLNEVNDTQIKPARVK